MHRAGEGGQGADLLCDDWETPSRVPSSPELHLEGFDGPLDLLLDLVERKRIDLRRVSPRAMVEQFANALERYAPHVRLERRADWLVMAARLVLLRSRLFPASLVEERAAEREVRDTHRQLDARRAMRGAVSRLDARPQLGRDVFGRPVGVSPRVSSYMDLLEACLAVLLREEGLKQQHSADWEATLTVRPVSPYSVATIMASMRDRLQTTTRAECLERFMPPAQPATQNSGLDSRMALSATLIAALELARAGELTLSQDQPASGSQPILLQACPNNMDLDNQQRAGGLQAAVCGLRS